MYERGQIYRPPMEADTPLLQVTAGCSHNRCAFCTMYRKTAFHVAPPEAVEADLAQLRLRYGPEVTRIFLLGGDPMVLSARRLLELAGQIRRHFPKVETLTCYASIPNLRRKTDQELSQLRAAGYDQLYVGLETGYDPALALLNKGFTAREAWEQLERLEAAGMRYAALLMLGAAGKGNSRANVEATVRLLNRFPPFLISPLTTAVLPGSDLARLRDEGKYAEQTEREMLEEELLLVESLAVEDCWFFGSHYYNLASAQGRLPQEREQILAAIRQALEEFEPEILDSVLPRSSV